MLSNITANMREEVKGRMRLVATTLAHDINTLLNGYKLSLGLLNDWNFRNQSGVDSIAHLYPAFSAVMTVDSSGRVSWASAGTSERGHDLSRRDFYVEITRTRLPYLSSTFITEGDYTPTAVLAVPYPGGSTIGYLRLAALSEYLSSLPVQGSEKIAVVDRNGYYVAAADPRLIQERENLALEDWFKTEDLEMVGNSFTDNHSGGVDLVSWAPVGQNSGWTIVVTESSDQAFRVVAEVRFGTSLMLLISWLLSMVLIVMMLFFFDADIRSLRRYTETIAAGAYDADFMYMGFKDLLPLAHDYEQAVAAVRDREARMTASLTEKEILLKEIHHRVKNNLQLVVSLLTLKSNGMGDLDNAFTDSIDRIRVMATIHELLYESADFAHIDLSEYVTTIVEWILSSYAYGPDAPRLRLDLASLELDIDAAVPCGLIINELFTNAIKYAFKSGAVDPTISVTTAVFPDGMVQLVVSDNGRGIPDSVDPERVQTLGMQLIVSLTSQLHGTWSLSRSGGSTWTIVFPQRVSTPAYRLQA
jgi:two-component sensor histidine kinase